MLFLQNAVLIKAWVGLRPIRDSIRVEREIMQVSSKYGTKTRLQVNMLQRNTVLTWRDTIGTVEYEIFQT